jgi:hypothetical protein
MSTCMKQDIYENFPLPTKSSIRLLQLATFEASDAGTFRLQPFDIRDAPPYIALSYTWGSPLPPDVVIPDSSTELEPHSIRCSGRDIPITKNLFNALSAFIDMRLDGFFWIDAICINQSDSEERAAQVRLMGKIYSLAEKVLVWLGPESNDSLDFIWLHNEFLPELRKHLGDEFLEHPLAKNLTVSYLLERELEDPTVRARSYATFYERAWFYRAWIIQEVVLAKAVVFLCSRTFLRLRDLDEFYTLIRDNNGTLGLKFMAQNVTMDKTFPREVINHLVGLKVFHLTAFQEGLSRMMLEYGGNADLTGLRSTNLMYLAHQIRTCQITDQRDKIYANLGMLDSNFSPSEGDGDIFPVRYDHTTEDVYHFATCWYLQNNPLLYVFSLVEDRTLRSLYALPS